MYISVLSKLGVSQRADASSTENSRFRDGSSSQICTSQTFVALDWRSFKKDLHRGFVTLEAPDLLWRKIPLHQKDRQSWVALPTKQRPEKASNFQDSQKYIEFQPEALDTVNPLLG